MESTLNQNLIGQGQSILRNCVGQIPPSLFGVERLAYLNVNVLPKLHEKQRMTLRLMFETYLVKMREMEASDIEIGSPGAMGRIWMRIHGNKRPVREMGTLPVDESDTLILALLAPGQREILLEDLNYDFSYVAPDKDNHKERYRATIYLELNHLALNLRAVNAEVRPYQSFRFHPAVTRILSLAHTHEGLVLVTGVTGSGKTSTMDSIIDINNQASPGHIVIIASPIEYVHQSKRCLVKHREVGADTKSFQTGAHEALRQDPDMIVIGEMRDPDTIYTVLEAADTGHKVISTLHTSSSVESIERIIGEMPSLDQNRIRNRLGDVLRCVIAQKLVPSLDGRRIMAREVMIITPSVRAAIKNGNLGEIYQMISEGKDHGMVSMEQNLQQLYHNRKISLETALNYANNKRRMKQLLHDKLLTKNI